MAGCLVQVDLGHVRCDDVLVAAPNLQVRHPALQLAPDRRAFWLPIWLPKGATVRRGLERWVTDLEIRRGYQHVITPDVAKVDLYKTSGHWAHYKDAMFPIMKAGDEEMVLRPMNCPHHIQVYQHEQRSYRDLPLRIAEFGTMW